MNIIAKSCLKLMALFGFVSLLSLGSIAQDSDSTGIAVRNDIPRVGQQEVLMLRHAYLEKDQYQTWYEASRDNVWPWFEKLGARIVGDWQVIYPEGESDRPESDEALRLARYASYEHWQSTRPSTTESAADSGGSTWLSGNGPDFQKSNNGLALRRTVSTGSKGGIFLQGYMADNGPIFMPGTGERFEVSDDSASGNAIVVRHDIARPDEQLLTLVYWKIKKGAFEEFHALTRDGIYPFFTKIGVRPVGLWRVAYLPGGVPQESDDYDEVYLLARYASYAHYQATRQPAQLGGNGPDFAALQDSLQRRQSLIQDTSIQFMQGPLFPTPPLYMPALDENYTKID